MIVAFALQKGGTGKTTTAVNMATCLAQAKRKVCLIDLDPQGNAGINLGIDIDKLKHTVYTVLLGKSTLKETIIKTKFGVDIIPSNDDLSELDMVILENREVFKNPVNVLKNVLQPLNEYEYILIDLPPSKGLLTINALTASSHVIIPMQCEYLATSGVNKIMDTIQKVQKTYNPDLKILGIVPTMFNVRTNLSSIVLQEARKHFKKLGVKVFDTTIYRSIKFAEAPMMGEPAVVWNTDNEHIKAYRELTREVFNVG